MKTKARNILSDALLILVFSFTPLKGFADDGGSVCLGPNLMFAPYTAEVYVSLTIDDSEQINFFRQGEEPRIVISGLDLQKIHIVKVLHQNEVTHSWKLDFRKFKTRLVQIWRGPGIWHMKDACGGACGSSQKCR